MSKTKIAGLGVVVLVVVALTGCNVAGSSRGPGFGYQEIKPPVERAALGTGLMPSTISSIRSSSDTIVFDGLTDADCVPPEPGAQPRDRENAIRGFCEYRRFVGTPGDREKIGVLGRIDQDMQQLDIRAQGEGVPECVNSAVTPVVFELPKMGGEFEDTLTTSILCREIHEKHPNGVVIPETDEDIVFLYATLFGLDRESDTFYLAEVQDSEFKRGVQFARSLLVSIAQHKRFEDEVLVWAFSIEKDHDESTAGQDPDLGVDWSLSATRINADPSATSGDRLSLFTIDQLGTGVARRSLDVTISADPTPITNVKFQEYNQGDLDVVTTFKFDEGNRKAIVDLFTDLRFRALDPESPIGLFTPGTLID